MKNHFVVAGNHGEFEHFKRLRRENFGDKERLIEVTRPELLRGARNFALSFYGSYFERSDINAIFSLYKIAGLSGDLVKPDPA